MSVTVTPEHYGDLVEVATRPDYEEWLTMVRATGGCAAPIHLRGKSTTLHKGGTGAHQNPRVGTPARRLEGQRVQSGSSRPDPRLLRDREALPRQLVSLCRALRVRRGRATSRGSRRRPCRVPRPCARRSATWSSHRSGLADRRSSRPDAISMLALKCRSEWSVTLSTPARRQIRAKPALSGPDGNGAALDGSSDST
jgi:hypothetical protein